MYEDLSPLAPKTALSGGQGESPLLTGPLLSSLDVLWEEGKAALRSSCSVHGAPWVISSINLTTALGPWPILPAMRPMFMSEVIQAYETSTVGWSSLLPLSTDQSPF